MLSKTRLLSLSERSTRNIARNGGSHFPDRSVLVLVMSAQFISNVHRIRLAMKRWIWLCFAWMHYASASCSTLGNCHGHGVCTLYSRCECFEGWGAKTDITTYRAPDCSARVCPSGTSWGDVPQRNGDAHNLAECSDRGICDRLTGKCKCAAGYEGSACQRLKCPNNCSGHGICVTMERLATKSTGFPLSNFDTTYQSSNVSKQLLFLFYFSYLMDVLHIVMSQSSQAWDSLMVVGCLCESSWPVGLKVNETQASEWFGPDCSLRKMQQIPEAWLVALSTNLPLFGYRALSVRR